MVNKIIFIGGNRYNEDGPLLHFIDICREQAIGVFLITDKQRINYPTKSYGTFKNALIKKNIKYKVVDNLKINLIKNIFNIGDHIISVNCQWIIKKDIICHANGKIYNYHGASLPEQRGAACHSWRIMQGITNSRLTFHELTTEIDKGEIICEKNIKFPLKCNNLEKSYKYLETFEGEFFSEFLEIDKVYCKNQKDDKSYYWPRLNTEEQGFIDWSWRAKDIVRFCNAFDKPFAGASTFYNSYRIMLRDVSVDDTDTYFHPFQAGLLYRKNNNCIWIAANGGGIKVMDVINESNAKLNVGKRFFTPQNNLLQALLFNN